MAVCEDFERVEKERRARPDAEEERLFGPVSWGARAGSLDMGKEGGAVWKIKVQCAFAV